MTIRLQKEAFDVGTEIDQIAAQSTDIGAVVSFVGVCRAMSESTTIHSMTLEHYPGMTERHLQRLEEEAYRRWPLRACLIVHRYGQLFPKEPIVLVVTASVHRHDAFVACEFLIDGVKTKAPFWKSEDTTQGHRWVEPRSLDAEAVKRWKITP